MTNRNAISVQIYRADNNRYICSEYGPTMASATNKAIAQGKALRARMQTNLYLRDCLGGLRAEILPNGKVKRTN